MLLLALLALQLPGPAQPRSADRAQGAKGRSGLSACATPLAAASEAEKSAVLAVTDQDSQAFADQTRAATAEVERLRTTLGEMLADGAGQREKEQLAVFSECFGGLSTDRPRSARPGGQEHQTSRLSLWRSVQQLRRPKKPSQLWRAFWPGM